jgi:hypothetical protein
MLWELVLLTHNLLIVLIIVLINKLVLLKLAWMLLVLYNVFHYVLFVITTMDLLFIKITVLAKLSVMLLKLIVTHISLEVVKLTPLVFALLNPLVLTIKPL